MITKLKRTIALINGCLIFLSVLIISINANAKISDSASIYLISKLLKKLTPEQGDIDYKYPPEVEEYRFTMRVSDPKDHYFEKRINKLHGMYDCRFSIFKDGTTKIETFYDIYPNLEDKPGEEFLDSVNDNSDKFKETMKSIVRNIELTDQESRYIKNYVTFEPELNIKHDGKSNFQKTTVTNVKVFKSKQRSREGCEATIPKTEWLYY